MIDKLNLKEGSYYIGTCRNTNIAQWRKGEFIFIGFNFGSPYIETIKYYGDVKNTSFDGFIPIEEINFNVDSIIKEKIAKFAIFRKCPRRSINLLFIDILFSRKHRELKSFAGSPGS